MTPPVHLGDDLEPVIDSFFAGDIRRFNKAIALKMKLQCAWVSEWLRVQETKNIPNLSTGVWNDLFKALKQQRDQFDEIVGIVKHNVLNRLFNRTSSTTDNDLLKSIAVNLGTNLGINKDKIVPPVMVLSEEQLKVVEQGFAEPYRDASGLVARFRTYVNRIIKDWKDRKSHSPYGAIVQSSGTGKSRLISEYARQGGLVMYCCLRRFKSTGYPPQTPQGIVELLTADSLLKDENRAEYFYLCYMAAILDVYTSLVQKYTLSEDEWFQRHALFKHRINEDEQIYPQNIWSSVFSRMSELGTKFGDSKSEIGSRFAEAVRKLNRPVMYVFDEARALSETPEKQAHDDSLFRYLRRALKYSPEDARFGCCAMFLDTSSKIDTFLPTRGRDPSLRYLKPDDAANLECPFYLIDTFDELAKDAGSTIQSIDEFCQPSFLKRMGRPMWVTQTTDRDIIDIAKYKLVYSDKPEWNAKQSLAVLGTRMLLDIAPRTELASDLVGNYMRHCVFVSQARDFVWSVSPSEPVLVEAATQLMHEKANINPPPLPCMLKHLEEALLCGFVEAGPRGELVARIILLLAADHACQKKGLAGRQFQYAQVLTVGEYLNSLIGADQLQTLVSGSEMNKNMLKELLNGKIFFTYIVRAHYKPKRRNLPRFIARGAAILCRRNEEGVDIVIPALLEDQGAANLPSSEGISLIPEHKSSSGSQTIISSFTDTADVAACSATVPVVQQVVNAKSVIRIDPSRTSAIVIQVKNFESGTSDNRSDARIYLHPSKAIAGLDGCELPYVGIWMQVADIKNQVGGVQSIPLLGTSTRGTKLEERMLGMITDGVSTKTFPFLDELPSMEQATQGIYLDDFNELW